MGKKRVVLPPKGIDELIFPICERFFDRDSDWSADELAEWATQEMARRGKDVTLSRQQIYPVITKAIQRGYIRFCPPLDVHLGQRIADLSQIPEANINVVNAEGPDATDHLASAAADMTLELIKQAAKIKIEQAAKRKRKITRKHRVSIHLGLGAGRTTMLVAKHLGQVLRSADGIPGVERLVFHAISSGFLVEHPEVAPLTFLTFVRDAVVPVEYVGLFSEAMVLCKDFEDVKKRPGIEEAFQRAGEIDIVITSLASVKNEYGLLNHLEGRYAKLGKIPRRVGDVQFRPFDERGPVKDRPDGIRVVTLFELEDYRKMIQKPGKYLLLVAGPAHGGKPKSDALLPLFREPSLRVWSHACMDIANAREVAAELSP